MTDFYIESVEWGTVKAAFEEPAPPVLARPIRTRRKVLLAIGVCPAGKSSC